MTNTKKIIIYSKTGQLSQCIFNNAKDFGFTPLVIGRPEFPIDDFEKFFDFFKETKPSIIINCAAYNDVEGAEKNFEEAKLVNSHGPQIMARAAKAHDIPIIHISTDYVFDGNKNTPYLETDETNPINAYGKSKLLGEINVQKETENHAIIRTSWVFSPYSNNFLKTILAKAKQSLEPIDMVSDQINCPTSGIDLAKIILKIAQMVLLEPENKSLRGIFHATSFGVVSRFEYAKFILETARKYGLPSVEIRPISSDSLITTAKRPKYSALDTSKIIRTFGIELKDWRDGVIETIKILN